MAEIQRIKLPEGDYDVMEMEFSIRREDWNDYEFADGGRVRLRTTVLKIFRVLDEHGEPARTADGDPWYIVRHKTDVVPS